MKNIKQIQFLIKKRVQFKKTQRDISMARYKNLAQTFIDDIKNNRLPVGARLPALRKIATQYQISMTTATKTYEYLQETGWIYARPQSGFYVIGRNEMTPFPTLNANQIETRNPTTFAPHSGFTPIYETFNPLGTSMLAPELLPELALQRTINRITRRSAHTLFHYPESQGDYVLRQALSQHFRLDYLAFTAEELIITNSCIDATRIAIETVSEKGDTIAVCSPCFSGLLDLLSVLQRQIIEIPLSVDGLDLETLEDCMMQQKITAALLSTTHINPIGMTLPIEQKQALAQLAAQYQIPIIEDDIYAELSHHKTPSAPAKYWDKDGYILWCGSISKTLAAGLRLGWCLPGRYRDAYLKHHALTSLGVNSLVQICIAEFIQTGDYASHLHKTRLLLQKQIHQYRHFLQANLPPNASISDPMGGLVLWVRIPQLNASALEIGARKHGIDIRSGQCFSTYDAYQDCFRINCGWPLVESNPPEGAYQQLAKLCELVPKYVEVGTHDM